MVGLETAWRAAEEAEEEREIAALLSAGLVQLPTLLVWDRYARQLDNALLHDARRAWVHPEQVGHRELLLY